MYQGNVRALFKRRHGRTVLTIPVGIGVGPFERILT